MDITIKHDYLKKAVLDVSKVVSSKSPFPILSGIKLLASQGMLTLVGSNSEVVIERKIPMQKDGQTGEVRVSGSVIVSAKHLNELIKKLTGDINISVDENHLVTITSGAVKVDLKGLSADEYPNLPQVNQERFIKLGTSTISDLIKQTVFAVSKNETRPILTGVSVSIAEGGITFVATNSQRLAYSRKLVDANILQACVVPSLALHELLKLIGKETSDTIELSMNEQFILFKTNEFTLYSRLIEGNYPETSGLLPIETMTVITMNTKQLIKGIDRACLFASEWKNNNIYLELNEETLTISSTSTEIGKIEETQVVMNIEGHKNLKIACDGYYLLDALRSLDEEAVNISFSGSMKPILIRPVVKKDQLHLISPVRSI